MKLTPEITAAALLALSLVASASQAQQPASPSPSAAVDVSSSAPDEQAPAPAVANSKVRIVRLSEVKGDVQLDRVTGKGFEDAIVNLPIIERSRLQTGVGVAEVEFEDNSTLRIAPNSLVEFPQLELLPSGAKASTVTVLKGTAYVSLVNTKGNEFVLAFGQQKAQLQPSAHVRLELEPTSARLAVMDGSGQVTGPARTTEISKKKTFTFDLQNEAEPLVAKNVAPQSLDEWDHRNSDYHKSYANMSAFSGSSYSYGVSDMQYYGSFMNSSGCGNMWRPYFVSASWDPYANGTWAWYQNAGYSWVSPYPWGWTPFHTGSWSYCNGTGWGWQPGGQWNGLNNSPASATSTSGPTMRRTLLPPRRPVLGQPTLVAVNTKPLTRSTLSSNDTFVFRNDSAGLGVPRGTLGRLDRDSARVMQGGTATTTVYTSSPGSGPGAARGVNPGSSISARSGATAGTGRSVSSSNSASSASHASSPSFSGSMGSASSGATSTASSGGGASRH